MLRRVIYYQPTHKGLEAPENYDISTSCLTGTRSASELRSHRKGDLSIIARHVLLRRRRFLEEVKRRSSLSGGGPGWVRSNGLSIINRVLLPTKLQNHIDLILLSAAPLCDTWVSWFLTSEDIALLRFPPRG